MYDLLNWFVFCQGPYDKSYPSPSFINPVPWKPVHVPPPEASAHKTSSKNPVKQRKSQQSLSDTFRLRNTASPAHFQQRRWHSRPTLWLSYGNLVTAQIGFVHHHSSWAKNLLSHTRICFLRWLWWRHSWFCSVYIFLMHSITCLYDRYLKVQNKFLCGCNTFFILVKEAPVSVSFFVWSSKLNKWGTTRTTERRWLVVTAKDRPSLVKCPSHFTHCCVSSCALFFCGLRWRQSSEGAEREGESAVGSVCLSISLWCQCVKPEVKII